MKVMSFNLVSESYGIVTAGNIFIKTDMLNHTEERFYGLQEVRV
jgi:hypothetical protein